MELLRELVRLQHEVGCLDHETLAALSKEKRVPQFRLQELVSFYPHFRTTPPARVTVNVCRDVCCRLAGVAQAAGLRDAMLGRSGVEIREVSCLGRCDAAPAATVNETPFCLVDLSRVIQEIDGPQDEEHSRAPEERGTWRCDPYATPADRFGTVLALVRSGADVRSICVERLKASGLRGMGGAGFPTGTKWDFVARETATAKYVICNADESEPGTFKDREILRNLPHLVIEGMALAGLSVGAQQGIVYLRHEYAPEQKCLEAAIAAARRRGVLGEDAAGSGMPFDVDVFISPGGYILGEETALLEALEDKRGEPRNKPPYPGTHGLWGQPTLINNVETFAFATSIVHHGPEWWKSQGKGDFCGLKIACVSGDVVRPGVYEIPMGTTVAELIELAGGMQNGRRLRAFLPGGASSNFLPASRADTPLDFDAMKRAGSMLGTAAVIAVGEGRDLFALAVNLVTFFRNESCGKCVPCRVGSHKAVELLEQVQSGRASAGELEILADLGETLEQTSICGLGQVALNPILSMLKHFPEAVPR